MSSPPICTAFQGIAAVYLMSDAEYYYTKHVILIKYYSYKFHDYTDIMHYTPIGHTFTPYIWHNIHINLILDVNIKAVDLFIDNMPFGHFHPLQDSLVW